jgi:hypothetical protein
MTCNTKILKVTIIFFIFLFTGCAYQSTGIYEKSNGIVFNTPNQLRIASASHWKVIAENEAKALKETIHSKPLFVTENDTSNFAKTYYNFLTESLLKNGAFVFVEKKDNITITYDVRVSTNNRGKQTSELDDKSSFLIFPAAVQYILSEAIGLIKIPFTVLGEQMVKNLSSATEVIITTRAIDKNRLLYSSSNVYYIEGINQKEYQTLPNTSNKVSSSDWFWNYRIPNR